MSEERRAKLFAELSETAKLKIEQEYTPCGYKDDIIDEIAETIRMSQSWPHPVSSKSSVLEAGLDFCIEKSYSDAQRFEKDVCYYIEMSLSPGKHWFRNFVLGHRGQ